MASRLPLTIPPARNETVTSYVARLAGLHGMPFAELWPQVSTPRSPTGRTRTVAADRLAAVTTLPLAHLIHALPELRRPEPDWWGLRHEPQRGCPLCTARHPGGPVLQLLPHYRYVCTSHGVWIGPPDLPDHPYPRLIELPEILAAQRAHLRLLRRHGPAATYDAVLTGLLICAHRWNNELFSHTDTWREWTRRVDRLVPAGTEASTFSVSRLFAVIYPEAVTLAPLFASLHWRRQAAGGPDEQRRFAAAIGQRLDDPEYLPTAANDPIAHWIEQDCWQPPSLPAKTYRTTRDFGGSPPRNPSKQNLARHRRSNYWFAVNRRGGKVLLHHRHLNAVLIRDWSTPPEFFIGAIIDSAMTSANTTRTTGATTIQAAQALLSQPYLRAEPAASDYLATATAPVPWPTPDSPRIRHATKPGPPRRATAPPQSAR